MALADWQRGLAALITAPAVRPPSPSADLSPREHAWLTATARDPGLHVTRDVQRTWRRTRLTAALPLTMAALPTDVRAGLVAGFLDACPCVSFFHVHEGRAFLRFLAAEAPELSHALALAALEVAIHDAEEWLVFADEHVEPRMCPDDVPLRLHPAATRVRFDAPPGQLLACVLAGRPLPPADGSSHELLVAPGLPSFARALADPERLLLDLCDAGATLAGLEARVPDGRALATTLLHQRALAPA